MADSPTESRVDPQFIAARVKNMKMQHAERDLNHARVVAIRRGDYEAVAPGMFSDAGEFGQPMVANLIDTAARDISEVMAPLPAVRCPPPALDNETDRKRHEKRERAANSYIQRSRLQDQMFGGTDRYATFGYMAYIVEPDAKTSHPFIRVDDSPAYYTLDWHGKTVNYAKVFNCDKRALLAIYPQAREQIEFHYAASGERIEVFQWMDAEVSTVVTDKGIVLAEHHNTLSQCPVRIVERPVLIKGSPRGQFDDVLWVQVARAALGSLRLEAVRRSATAPIVVPDDVEHIDFGPYSTLVTKNPQGVGAVPLNVSQGLFPEAAMLQQEQMLGSRYPEGRSGTLDASIITGQGVEALMGTFNTQVQTFQRLNRSALEDVIGLCFEMDEKVFGHTEKTVYVKDNGAAQQLTYVPAQDINGNYSVDVSYGAIAGLEPNRGLIFVLQAMAGGMLSKGTGQRALASIIDIDVQAESRAIQMEEMDGTLAASIASLAQAIPMLATQGGDARGVVEQITQMRTLLSRGKSISEAAEEVWIKRPDREAAKEPAAAAASPLEALLAQAQQGGGGAPPAPSSPGSDLLMMMSGMTPGGSPQMSANVSRMRPTQG